MSMIAHGHHSTVRAGLLAAFAAATLSAAVSNARASAIEYNTLSAFDAATNSQSTSNFNGYSYGTGFEGYSSVTVGSGVTLTGTSNGLSEPINVNEPSYANTTNNFLTDSISNGPPYTLTITFPSTTAFGLDFGTSDSGVTVSYALSNGDSVPTTVTAQDFFTGLEFIGFASTDPFDSITISFSDGSGWGVEDVVTATAVSATPLPAALPMFAGGLGMVGFLARRKKQKALAAA